MCVWAHRLMGEGWALALTQHPTHTHRELEREREGKKERVSQVEFTPGRRNPARVLNRRDNELVPDWAS